jgi:hypothetical protein
MNGRVILGDVIMGSVLGAALYFVAITFWPAIAGPVSLALIASGSVVAVLFRAPGGALYRPGASSLPDRGERAMQKITSADLASITISPLLLRAVSAWLLGGIVLAILVPALHANGIELRQWMAWVVIIGAFSLLLGPGLARRFGRHDR